MSDKFESLSVEVADFVATVTLNRPPVNAQNRLFREEIDHGSAARRLVEPVEIISLGIRAKPLENRDVAAQGGLVYGTKAYLSVLVLVAISVS